MKVFNVTPPPARDTENYNDKEIISHIRFRYEKSTYSISTIIATPIINNSI
jgi:hypothetical protein